MTTGIGDEIAWWCPSLDSSGNGTTTLNDLAGSYDGTLTDMDAATDWVADTANGGVRALDFDGSNDFVSVPYSMVPTGAADKSLSLWFKTSGSVSTRQWLFYAGTDAFFGRFAVELEGSAVAFNNGNSSVYHSASISAETWYHVVIVYDGGNSVDLWVNGDKETYSIPGASSLSTGTTTTTRLGSLDGGTFNLQGRMDDVRVFDRALTNDEVSHLATGRAVLGDGTVSTVVIDADEGEFVVTGNATSLAIAPRIISARGTFVIAGSAATFRLQSKLIAESGALIVTGSPHGERYSRAIVSSVGAFVVTPRQGLLIGPAISLTAETGDFSLVGRDADVVVGNLFGAEPGTFGVVGADAFSRFTLLAAAGEFDLVGYDYADRTEPYLDAQGGLVLVVGGAATINKVPQAAALHMYQHFFARS